MMNKQLVILVSLLLFIGIGSGFYVYKTVYPTEVCNKEGYCSRYTNVKIASTVSDSKKVIYETNRVIITFGYESFINQTSSHTNVYDFVKEKGKESDTITISKKDMFVGELSNVIESGRYSLYDKKFNKFVQEIIVDEYYFRCSEPMCGHGGKRYLLPDKTLFYRGVEWIS